MPRIDPGKGWGDDDWAKLIRLQIEFSCRATPNRGRQDASAGEVALFDWSHVAAVEVGHTTVPPEWFAQLAACFPHGLHTLEW